MPELQSMRGIAAVVVVLGHCGAYYAVPPWFAGLQRVLVNGEASVVVFFVLSGFVLAGQLARSEPSARARVAFYVRRLFRIYPALWLASGLALVYLAYFHWTIPVPGTSSWFQARFRAERFSLLGIVASLAGVLAFLLPPLWSIFVELAGSALMPLLAWVSKKRWTFCAVGVALLVVSVTVGPRTYYGVGVYLLDFWIGAGVFMIAGRTWRVLTPPPSIAAALMIAAVSTFLWGRLIQGRTPNDPLSALYWALGAAILILAAARGWPGVGALRTPWLASLGDSSYSLYLLHFPIMCLAAKGIQLEGGAALDPAPRALLLATVTLAAALPLSALSYRFVEVPGIRLGGWVLTRRGRGRAPPSIATSRAQAEP